MRNPTVRLNAEGLYYIGMLAFVVAGAIIRDINLLYVMAGMMLGPLLLSFFIAPRTLRRLELKRRFPRLISAGEPLNVDIIAKKTGAGNRASFAVVAEERICRENGGRRAPNAGAKVFFSRIPASGVAEASYRVRLFERGQYRFEPLEISTSLPIGLVRASVRHGIPEHVLVSPRLGQLLPAWSKRLKLSHEGSQRSKRRRGKTGGDFYGMREWRNGDAKAAIHWRTSAKRNKLTVRQFEQRISQDLVIILDLWQPKIEARPRHTTELAVSFVATVVFEHGRHGASHMTVASASRHRFELRGSSSPVFRREVMEHLAMVEPTGDDQLASVLAEVLPSVPSNSRIVLVSSRKIDLDDTKKFSEVLEHAHLQRMFSEIICVNTSSREFSSLFAESKASTRGTESRPEPSGVVEP